MNNYSNNLIDAKIDQNEYIEHYGVKGQKWGQRRYQNYNGSYLPGAKGRYGRGGVARNGSRGGGRAVSVSSGSSRSSRVSRSRSGGSRRGSITRKVAIGAGIAAAGIGAAYLAKRTGVGGKALSKAGRLARKGALKVKGTKAGSATFKAGRNLKGRAEYYGKQALKKTRGAGYAVKRNGVKSTARTLANSARTKAGNAANTVRNSNVYKTARTKAGNAANTIRNSKAASKVRNAGQMAKEIRADYKAMMPKYGKFKPSARGVAVTGGTIAGIAAVRKASKSRKRKKRR